ncbi:unnamed protein product, partial [Ixodes pacificus]
SWQASSVPKLGGGIERSLVAVCDGAAALFSGLQPWNVNEQFKHPNTTVLRYSWRPVHFWQQSRRSSGASRTPSLWKPVEEAYTAFFGADERLRFKICKLRPFCLTL